MFILLYLPNGCSVIGKYGIYFQREFNFQARSPPTSKHLFNLYIFRYFFLSSSLSNYRSFYSRYPSLQLSFFLFSYLYFSLAIFLSLQLSFFLFSYISFSLAMFISIQLSFFHFSYLSFSLAILLSFQLSFFLTPYLSSSLIFNL